LDVFSDVYAGMAAFSTVGYSWNNQAKLFLVSDPA
jgi:hypothetical protein